MENATFQTTTEYLNDSTIPTGFDKEIPWPLSVQVILALIVGSTSIFTVIGNLIVIHAYFTTRALQTYTNFYIINLAILDLIGGLFPMPMYGAYWILGYWPLSVPMCDFYLWVNHATLNATSYAILIVAIDRYRSVVHPIKHFQQRTQKHAFLWISFCYTLSLLIWTPAIFIWPAVGGRSFPSNFCQPEYTNSFGFAAFAQLELFWIPLVAMAILYTKVYRVYRQRMGKKETYKKEMKSTTTYDADSGISGASSTKNTDISVVHSSGDSGMAVPGSSNGLNRESSKQTLETPRMKKENNRAVRTLSLIFAVFLASGLPWGVLVIVFKMCPGCIPLALYQASVYLARISSLLNPLCYAAANTLFRDAFKRVLCFWRRSK